MKASAAMQERLAKQNEISRQKLVQELVKLEKMEKSDLRMIETARHRFRSRHRKLENLQQPSGSNAINVRMYETHNPGFCYHCTGAIKEVGVRTKEQAPKDSYEFVRSIVFTNDEVDTNKLLCLHLLTAHSTKWNNDDGINVRPVTSLLEKARNKHFSGAWNNILPCYVVDTEKPASDVKLHEDPRQQSLEAQAIRDFEEKYRQYVENNDDFGKALSYNANCKKFAMRGLNKLPAISPHVYSLLGASHELRIKQALAEGVARKRFARSTMEFSGLDETSMSFRLDDDDDLSSRITGNTSNRNWATRSALSPSRRSAIAPSVKFDHGLTMLKPKRHKFNDHASNRLRSNESNPRDLVTIKSSFRGMREAPSKTSSTKSPFRGIFGSRTSTNSLISRAMSPEAIIPKFRKCIYLNVPIQCVELQNKEFRIVPIFVNYQIQALVQAVLEVLERVNPEKTRRIIETARDTEKMKTMLMRPETQSFVQSLLGQTLMSSPESFVVSAASIADEIDFRFEGILEKEIIALTMEMPQVPSLDALITEIRQNIFVDSSKKNRPNEIAKEASTDTNEQVARKQDNEKEISTMDCPRKNSAKCEICDDTSLQGKKYNYRKRSRKQSPTKVAKKSNEDSLTEIFHAKPKRSSKKSSSTKTEDQAKTSGYGLANLSNTKNWKGAQDPAHLDADHVILRRLTNTQRILVGQMCASLKTKKINNQGLINESVPLAALIAPALSRESIKLLTRGTVYSKADSTDPQQEEEVEEYITVPDKLTGPLLAKIRQDVAENETKRRLKRFLQRETK